MLRNPFNLALLAGVLCVGQTWPPSLAGADPETGYGYGGRRDAGSGPVVDLRRPAPPNAEPLLGAPPDAREGDAPAVQRRQAEQAGRTTATGERFDPAAMIAAHPTLPLPSLAQIANLENGRSVVVRVNDRSREVEVSPRVADELGLAEDGRARISVRYLGPAPRALASASPAGLSRANTSTARRQTEAGFFVQVGAFRDAANARRVQEALGRDSPARIEPISSGAAAFYRVRLGPWPDRSAAEAMRARVAALGFSDAIIAPR